MTDKIKLFETVLGIHAKGTAQLTASERSTIEAETQDLLQSAKKTAAKAPEGFEKLLSELTSAENADEAYEMVVGFLKSQDQEKPLEKPLEKPMDDLMDKGEEKPKEDKLVEKPLVDKFEKEPKEDLKKPDEKPLGDKFEKEPKEDKKDLKDKKDDKGKADKLLNLEKEKKDIMARAKRLASDEAKKDLEKLKGEGKEDKKDDKDAVSAEEMGVKDPTTASKVKVRVTSSKNLVVTYDSKPLFHAIPNAATKADANSLRMLANKVYGWVVYEGAKAAAHKCGAKLMAGADSDVDLAMDADIKPSTKGITDGVDTVTEEKPEDPKDDITDDAEDVVEEEPKEPEEDIVDEAEDVVEEEPKEPKEDSGDDAEDVIDENIEEPAKSILDDGESVIASSVLDEAELDIDEKIKKPFEHSQEEIEVDYKEAEVNFKKLYAARADKTAKELNNKFVKKFIRAFKIASHRMNLNYEENPYKAASVDVLTSNNVNFSDGSILEGLDVQAASELTELISNEGHSQFVDRLLERTASLMKKSDEYLVDLESDLAELNVKPVEVDAPTVANKKRSSKSNKVRKDAAKGNFALTNTGTHVARSTNNDNVGGLRDVIGDTPISRLSRTLAGDVG